MSNLVDTLGPLSEQWHGYIKYYDVQGDDGWCDQSRILVEHETLMLKVARRQPAVSQEEQELVVGV
jgi:hypothetical protein